MVMSLLCPGPDLITLVFLLVGMALVTAVPVVVAAGFVTALIKLIKELSAKK